MKHSLPSPHPPEPALPPAAQAEWKAGLKQGLLLGAMALLLGLPQERQAAPAAEAFEAQAGATLLGTLDLNGVSASPEAERVARWVVASGDHGGRAFAVVDKREARVLVFEPSGRLVGSAPVLLGAALGDDSAPGIGQRPISQVRPEERTTPAGRFAGEAGRNLVPEDVVWVDYENAVSMHRVRTTNAAERRLERLATPTVRDNRISYGCINVPVNFFEGVLWPRFRASGGMVYVLPDRKPLTTVFPMLAAAPLPPGALPPQ